MFAENGSRGNGIKSTDLSNKKQTNGMERKRETSSKGYLRIGDSYMSERNDPRSDGIKSQVDIRYSKNNKKFQVYYNNHALLEDDRFKGEIWFHTREEAENFAKNFVKEPVPNVNDIVDKERTELYDALGNIGIDPSGAIGNYPKKTMKKIVKSWLEEGLGITDLNKISTTL